MHYIIIQLISAVKRSSSWRLSLWEELKSIKNIAFMSKDRPHDDRPNMVFKVFWKNIFLIFLASDLKMNIFKVYFFRFPM